MKAWLRRIALTGVCLLATGLLLSFSQNSVQAADFLPYPSRNSDVLDPFGPGDEVEMLLRLLQQGYERNTGRTLSIVNAQGRAGANAWGQLSTLPPDGYHLAAINLPNLVLRSLGAFPVYRLEEIRPICLLAELPLALWVPKNSPFRTLEDLVEAARANPGRIILAGAGSQSVTHLATLRFNRLAGVYTLHLPFMGSNTAMGAVQRKQAHAAWGYALPLQGQRNDMRPLAVSSGSRYPALPEAPTFAEQNYDFVQNVALGLALPAQTPRETAAQVSTVFLNVARTQDFQSRLTALGFTPRLANMGELAALLKKDLEDYSSLAQDFDMLEEAR